MELKDKIKVLEMLEDNCHKCAKAYRKGSKMWCHNMASACAYREAIEIMSKDGFAEEIASIFNK